jgi:hypothetical protein
MMLAIGLSYIAFIMLRTVPSSSSSFRAFIIKGCSLFLRFFLHLLIRWCGFCPWFLMCYIVFIHFQMLYHPFIMEWNIFDHCVWSF